MFNALEKVIRWIKGGITGGSQHREHPLGALDQVAGHVVRDIIQVFLTGARFTFR